MAFKKIIRKVKHVEPAPKPDPNQLNIITEIEKLKPGQDGSVKWSNPIAYDPDSTSIGMIVALQPFNPLAHDNVFAILIYSMQKPGNGPFRRLMILNQDWSPKVDGAGKLMGGDYHINALAYVGYARGKSIS